MDSPRWHWLDDGLLPLLLTTVRAAWLWPWLQWLHHWLTPAAPPWLPLWAIFALLLGATWTTQFALVQTGSIRRARGIVVGVGLLALLGVMWVQVGWGEFAPWDSRWLVRTGDALAHPEANPLPLFTLILGVGLWLRGVREGQERLGHEDVWRVFVSGLIALALLLVIAQFTPQGVPPGTEGWLLVLVAAGLSALALASLQLARITGRWQAGHDPQLPLNRYWLVSVSVVIAGMLVLGLLVGAILSPEMVARAFGWVPVVLDWIGFVLGYIVLAVSYLIFLLLTPLYEWLRARLGDARPAQPLELERFATPESPVNFATTEIAPELVETMRWVGVAGLLILAGLVIALALRYLRKRDAAEVEETRETIFTQSLLQAQLAALWQQWRQRLRRAAPAVLSPYLSLVDEQADRRTIRALYQELLGRAKVLGHPRARGQTPAEYMAQLATAYPAAGAAWEIVAQEYGAARYGRPAPTPEQVERMRQACAEIQRVLTPAEAAPGDT